MAQLDTGPYATAQTHPYGSAGDNPLARAVLESQRLAAVTVGPWQVDRVLTGRGPVSNWAITGVAPTGELLGAEEVLPAPLPQIAARGGLLAGFSSLRLAATTAGGVTGLQTVLLRFPDPAAATATASALFAADPGPPDAAGARRPVQLRGLPAALAAGWELPGQRTAVHGVTADGPFVAVAVAQAPAGAFGGSADTLVQAALTAQRTRLAGGKSTSGWTSPARCSTSAAPAQ